MRFYSFIREKKAVILIKSYEFFASQSYFQVNRNRQNPGGFRSASPASTCQQYFFFFSLSLSADLHFYFLYPFYLPRQFTFYLFSTQKPRTDRCVSKIFLTNIFPYLLSSRPNYCGYTQRIIITFLTVLL